MLKIDINCDLGEGFGIYNISNDEELLNYITSANIACGFHGGDPCTMNKTVKIALEKGVAIGAHPGLPDLMGFGRRVLKITPQEAKDYIIYQVAALNGFVKAHGGRLQHVKPHGALYNMAAADYNLSLAIAEAVISIDPQIILMGLAGSNIIKAAEDVGLKHASEAFADRNYHKDGSLVNRNNPLAIIHDVKTSYDRVVKMIKEGHVLTIDGEPLDIKADSICIHGDNPMALSFVKGLRDKLEDEGILLKSLF